jgi:hypothetical protein
MRKKDKQISCRRRKIEHLLAIFLHFLLSQAATDQISSSYRSSIPADSVSSFDRHERKKHITNSHRSALAMLKTTAKINVSTAKGQQRSSNVLAGPMKRIA